MSEALLNAYVTCTAQVVALACGGHEASDISEGFTGAPDVHIYEVANGQPKLIGEVKTFWAFPFSDDKDLVELYNTTLENAETPRPWHHVKDNPKGQKCDCKYDLAKKMHAK
ncbi:unnamed protein product [Aphanomyces euteiches]